MDFKDYYSILEVAPSATVLEIRQQFRKLALQYHPDKNPGNPASSIHFSAIKEAYDVLTNPPKKAFYLQQRWLNQSLGKQKQQTLITASAILKQAIEVEQYISRLDHFRLDQNGLSDYILMILSDDTIEKLNAFQEIEINEEIVAILLSCLEPLPLPAVLRITKQLKKICTGTSVAAGINHYLKSRQQKNQKDKFMVWIMLMIVIFICLLIYFQAG